MGKWPFLKQFCLYALYHVSCVYIENTHKKMWNSDLYSGVLTKRKDNSVLLKASTKLALSFQAREASNGFDAQTEHTLGLQAASWKFAADDRSSEIKMLFMSSLLCLCLGGWPELNRNTPRTHTHPCVHHSMNLASTHVSRRSYRCHFTALINTKPLRPSQIITYTTQS